MQNSNLVARIVRRNDCPLARMALAFGLLAAVTVSCGADSGGDGPLSTGRAAVTLNTVTRESFDNQGRQGNGSSNAPYISASQRYVVFQSDANVWAPSVDTNGTTDIYLKDRQVGSITLISQSNGVVGNGQSFSPSVSDDGTVVFASNATNLARGATGGTAILVRSPTTGVISRVDNAVSGQPNGASSRPQISGDGSTVIFQSNTSNLISGDTNNATDVFVASARGGGVAQRVSLTNANGEPNGASFDGSISYDGRFVAFSSDATNMLFNDGNGGRGLRYASASPPPASAGRSAMEPAPRRRSAAMGTRCRSALLRRTSPPPTPTESPTYISMGSAAGVHRFASAYRRQARSPTEPAFRARSARTAKRLHSYRRPRT